MDFYLLILQLVLISASKTWQNIAQYYISLNISYSFIENLNGWKHEAYSLQEGQLKAFPGENKINYLIIHYFI